MITTDNLVLKVRRLINEADNDPSISLITDDTRSLDTTIKELLPQAVALVQKNSGIGLVNAKSISPREGESIVITDYCATFPLPESYVSLVTVKLSNWNVPVTITETPSSAAALRQQNTATRATPSKPVCVAFTTNSRRWFFRMYPVGPRCSLEHLVYESAMNIDEGLDCCDKRMEDAVAYACVSLLYNVFERYDAAKSFMTYAMALRSDGENVKPLK